VVALVETQVWQAPHGVGGPEPGVQRPFWQVSMPLQALLSVQPATWVPLASGVEVQPVTVSQLSVVQGLPSLQLSGGPETHCPMALQVSMPLQTLPSEHEVPNGSGLLKQAPLAQPSVVQGLLSLQLGGVPATQPPLLQVAGLQKSLEHEVPLAAPALCAQPTPVWQLSTVQGLPSSQFGAVPAVQLPF